MNKHFLLKSEPIKTDFYPYVKLYTSNYFVEWI